MANYTYMSVFYPICCVCYYMNGIYEDIGDSYLNNCNIKSFIVNIYIAYHKGSKTIENYCVSYYHNNDDN